MTGPEHYLKAERLVAGKHIPADPDLGDPAEYILPTDAELAAAQVHATLALAAATALNDFEGGTQLQGLRAWQAAASVTATDGAEQ